jgi:hypothetical protein
MKQKAHTWIAIRAIGLIQEDPQTQNLAKVLLPWAKQASIGCWLPDMAGFKNGHGIVGNHTFKNAPYHGENCSRFILPKSQLLDALDGSLALREYVQSESSLNDMWWTQPYKAEQKAGEHLPDCLSSLFETISDMLLLGDPDLEGLVPGTTGYGSYLDRTCALTGEQVSTFFFMLSHYIADSFMPCHADNRKLSSFTEGGIHEGWEKHWEKLVGPYYGKERLKATPDTSEQVVCKASDLDATLDLQFPMPLTWPKAKHDIWENAIFWCRASFALASYVFPPDQYPYDGEDQPRFDDVFTDQAKLEELDRVVLQSAVYAVASSWKQIWIKFKN